MNAEERADFCGVIGAETPDTAARVAAMQRLGFEEGRAAGPCAAKVLHPSHSAAQPVYVHQVGGSVYYSSRLRWLAETAGRLAPDWSAWAEIISLGAPILGRTTFVGIRRLQPGEYIRVSAEGRPELTSTPWAWVDHVPDPKLSVQEATSATLDAIRHEIAPHLSVDTAAEGFVNPMLSGGRDSRLLTALALRDSPTPERVTTWTTSSDTGTALEELIAARTAELLGVRQRIVSPWVSSFERDFRDYADYVDYQASFHVWLIPPARELETARGAVLDGIGGGVFLGGGFPDPADTDTLNEEQLIDARFYGRAHYLYRGSDVLAAGVTEAVTLRSRSDFDPMAREYVDHPNGHTLTAYLARTLPGISPAPARVLGAKRTAVMPILSDGAVGITLQLPHAKKADGAWYPLLLQAADARLADLPTAADLTKPRRHLRRTASREAARYFSQTLLSSPVRRLLAPSVQTASIKEWQSLLNHGRSLHLIRGLTMMALWIEDFGEVLSEVDFEELTNG